MLHCSPLPTGQRTEILILYRRLVFLISKQYGTEDCDLWNETPEGGRESRDWLSQWGSMWYMIFSKLQSPVSITLSYFYFIRGTYKTFNVSLPRQNLPGIHNIRPAKELLVVEAHEAYLLHTFSTIWCQHTVEDKL